MSIRKKDDIVIKPHASGRVEGRNDYVFYSFDRNSSQFILKFVDHRGRPYDLLNANPTVLLIIEEDGKWKKVVLEGTDIEEISIIDGKIAITIPEFLLGYRGKVDMYVGLTFDDGSSSDELHLAFTMKKSPFDSAYEEAKDYYVANFEVLLHEVELAKENAINEINKQLPETEKTLEETVEKLAELKAEIGTIDFGSFQKSKLTSDGGKALRLADLNPRPSTIDDLTRPGFYYITSAESNTFIPADHYIRQIGMAGSGWITVYPGDAGGVVVQEWYRNTASAVANTRHLYRKQESASPVTWNPWSEYAQTNSTMLSSSYYQGAAHRIAEATTNGKQATSYLELSENSGIYYLTTNESKAMSDFSSLPSEFIYGTYIENIPNSSLGNYFQKITSNILDGKAQLPVSYWRIVVKTDSGYDATKWRKYVSQDDAQMYKTTKDNGDSWRLEDLPAKPDGLEQWARLYKGWYYIPNSSLKTMSDYSTLPPEFANSHVHMEIQGGAGSVYARQTLTMYQAPFTQIYRVVTNTLAQPWQTVAKSDDVVNLTKNQSVGGKKDFTEIPTIEQSNVVSESSFADVYNKVINNLSSLKVTSGFSDGFTGWINFERVGETVIVSYALSPSTNTGTWKTPLSIASIPEEFQFNNNAYGTGSIATSNIGNDVCQAGMTTVGFQFASWNRTSGTAQFAGQVIGTAKSREK
ncbi:BppU family phage baseplate upper protein [Enterococcus thailandicus]|uniref:BppU family phage baseplate upper protein n=1 Tax=Enterococcus TaxID=1350 RepID=UPI0022EBBEE2|nr:BppU family phage baseplate upper protein [Enterococcus thailandicus]MDA3965445.1 BppU family phage baseplate upper protein [Enterococcus thailandicus]